MFREQGPHDITGTTTPIYVPGDPEPQRIELGKDYFFVQVHDAQAAFTGSIWAGVENLVVVTNVGINHKILGNDNLCAIQRTRSVVRNRAERLGMRPNLISLVPAIMPDFSISIDYILNQKNYLHDLTGLINSDAFLATVSLAPGTALIAKTISNLASRVIETFVPAQERKPILQFSGEFNLAGEGLNAGYYVILGSTDPHDPLPSPLPKLTVSDGELLADGERITQFSYVVLNIRRTPVRTRALNDGALWETKLREAEDESQRAGNDPFSTDDERRSTWDKCRNLLKEGQILLRNDSNYHRFEAETIIKAAFSQCIRALDINQLRLRGGGVAASPISWQPNAELERSFFDIPLDEDLDATLDTYTEQVMATRKLVHSVN